MVSVRACADCIVARRTGLSESSDSAIQNNLAQIDDRHQVHDAVRLPWHVEGSRNTARDAGWKCIIWILAAPFLGFSDPVVSTVVDARRRTTNMANQPSARAVRYPAELRESCRLGGHQGFQRSTRGVLLGGTGSTCPLRPAMGSIDEHGIGAEALERQVHGAADRACAMHRPGRNDDGLPGHEHKGLTFGEVNLQAPLDD